MLNSSSHDLTQYDATTIKVALSSDENDLKVYLNDYPDHQEDINTIKKVQKQYSQMTQADFGKLFAKSIFESNYNLILVLQSIIDDPDNELMPDLNYSDSSEFQVEFGHQHPTQIHIICDGRSLLYTLIEDRSYDLANFLVDKLLADTRFQMSVTDKLRLLKEKRSEENIGPSENQHQKFGHKIPNQIIRRWSKDQIVNLGYTNDSGAYFSPLTRLLLDTVGWSKSDDEEGLESLIKKIIVLGGEVSGHDNYYTEEIYNTFEGDYRASLLQKQSKYIKILYHEEKDKRSELEEKVITLREENTLLREENQQLKDSTNIKTTKKRKTTVFGSI